MTAGKTPTIIESRKQSTCTAATLSLPLCHLFFFHLSLSTSLHLSSFLFLFYLSLSPFLPFSYSSLFSFYHSLSTSDWVNISLPNQRAWGKKLWLFGGDFQARPTQDRNSKVASTHWASQTQRNVCGRFSCLRPKTQKKRDFLYVIYWLINYIEFTSYHCPSVEKPSEDKEVSI